MWHMLPEDGRMQQFGSLSALVEPSQANQREERLAYSIVIPVFDEEQSLPILYEQLKTQLQQLGQPYEMIFVDDGSRDGSWRVVQELHRQDPAVKAVRFRRNFGKTPALIAGFQLCRGEVIFTLDADLQDDPAEIPAFLAKLDEGYDLVSGWKFPRLDPISKTFPSRIFNKTVALTTGVSLHDMNCGFKAYRREVIDELRLYGELHRFIPVLAAGRGFKVTEIKVHHHPRKYGVSKFGARRFARGFLDLLMVLFLTTYMRTPLRLFGTLGFLSLLVGFLIDLYLVILKFATNDQISRHPLLFLGIVLMIFGLMMILTGFQSEMIRNFNYHPHQEYSVRQVLD
jgi:glycosyltransferase involved in cell wall biosynthesis